MYTLHNRTDLAYMLLRILALHGVQALVVGGLARDVLYNNKSPGGDIDIVVHRTEAPKVLAAFNLMAEIADVYGDSELEVTTFEHYEERSYTPLQDDSGEAFDDVDGSDFETRIDYVIRLEFIEGEHAGLHIDVLVPTEATLPSEADLVRFTDTFDFNINQCFGELTASGIAYSHCAVVAGATLPQQVRLVPGKPYCSRLRARAEKLQAKLPELDWSAITTDLDKAAAE